MKQSCVGREVVPSVLINGLVVVILIEEGRWEGFPRELGIGRWTRERRGE